MAEKRDVKKAPFALNLSRFGPKSARNEPFEGSKRSGNGLFIPSAFSSITGRARVSGGERAAAAKPAAPPIVEPKPPDKPHVSVIEIQALERQFKRAPKARRADIIAGLKSLGVDPLPEWAREK